MRLAEAQDELRAIRQGEVDAIIVQGPDGEQVFSLRETDNVYRLMVETMSEAGMTVSAGGVVLFANNRAEEILGHPSGGLVGRRAADLVPAGERPALDSLLRKAALGAANGRIEFFGANSRVKPELREPHPEFRGPEPASRGPEPASRGPEPEPTVPLHLWAHALSRPEGAMICLVGTDLTQLESYEAELRQRNDELELRARQLSRLASQLTLAEQRERRRVAQALHDNLQQLLVSAKMSLEAVGRRMGGTEQRAVGRIMGLLDESIAASRSLTTEILPPILQAAGLVAGLEWLARWMNEKHNLTVDVHAQRQDGDCREDIQILLFQSVRELLFNVTKHADTDRAVVELRRPEPGWLHLTVSDFGRGLDVASVESAALLDGLADEDGGSGAFGLFSIRERLNLLGGRLEIEGAPGRGARFTMIAPVQDVRARPAETPPSIAQAAALHLAVSSARRRCAAKDKVRVLLADDHASLRQGLAAMLSGEPDLEIAGEASNGEEAILAARRLQPDVIVMDCTMPVMDGVEATRVIHSELPGVRIVGLSVHAEADRAAAMLEAGAAAYFTKGGEPSALLAAIRR